MSILPQLIYKFNKIPIKIQTKLFGNIDKIILKFIWEGKGTRIARTFVLEKNRGRNQSIRFWDFIVTAIKTVWYWQDRHTDQWNRMKNLEKDPPKHTQQVCVFFLNWYLFERDTEHVQSMGQREKERDKESPPRAGSPMWGSVLDPKMMT